MYSDMWTVLWCMSKWWTMYTLNSIDFSGMLNVWASLASITMTCGEMCIIEILKKLWAWDTWSHECLIQLNTNPMQNRNMLCSHTQSIVWSFWLGFFHRYTQSIQWYNDDANPTMMHTPYEDVISWSMYTMMYTMEK